jgi:hypothetical protein
MFTSTKNTKSYRGFWEYIPTLEVRIGVMLYYIWEEQIMAWPNLKVVNK